MLQIAKNDKLWIVSSYLTSIVASWITLDIMLSDYDWWYWTESDGLKGIGILVVSVPLISYSLIIRLWKARKLERVIFLDLYCWIGFCLILVLSIFKIYFEYSSLVVVGLSALSIICSIIFLFSFGRIISSKK